MKYYEVGASLGYIFKTSPLWILARTDYLFDTERQEKIFRNYRFLSDIRLIKAYKYYRTAVLKFIRQIILDVSKTRKKIEQFISLLMINERTNTL